MSGIGSLLRHTVELVGWVASGAPIDPDGEDWGHPPVVETVLGTYRGLVQPRSARERASSGGVDANIGTHRIFLERAAIELPVDSDMVARKVGAVDDDLNGDYRIRFAGNAAGQGHHVELDADRIDA